MQVLAAWFRDAWAVQSCGERHEEVFFFGVIKKFNPRNHKFTCQFEEDPKQYPATWDFVADFVVRSSMQFTSPRKSMQVSHNLGIVNRNPSGGESRGKFLMMSLKSIVTLLMLFLWSVGVW